MKPAPIILFAYNRPWHTQQTLEALQSNLLADKSILYIYCDGPKENTCDEDLKRIAEVRSVVRSTEWCIEVTIIEREHNWGLASNVIDGVSEIVNRYGKIIVLEDDLITSPYFLTYCNEALELYKDAPNVYAINGYQFPLNVEEVTTFLSPQATSSWGWATWKDKWNTFKKEIDASVIMASSDHLKARFNLGDYDYGSMLENENSWAIRWYYSVFIRNGLGLFPTKTLVENIGFDGSGEHCSAVDYKQRLWKNRIQLKYWDEIDLNYYNKTLQYFSEKDEKSTPTGGLIKFFTKALKTKK